MSNYIISDYSPNQTHETGVHLSDDGTHLIQFEVVTTWTNAPGSYNVYIPQTVNYYEKQRIPL